MPALSKEDKARARRDTVRHSLAAIGAIAKRLLPKGQVKGAHWMATDPRLGDDSNRSISVHLVTGQWRNFRSNRRGQDIIGLLAHAMAETIETNIAQNCYNGETLLMQSSNLECDSDA